MDRILSFVLLLMVSGVACGASSLTHDVFSENGDYLGSLWTDREAWITCEDDPSREICLTDKVDPVHDPIVCMTYSNDCIVPIVCTMTVSALLQEPFTGFTKRVTDHRDEIVYYNQTQEICFNFAKDEYHAWFLTEVGDPELNCSELKEDGTNDPTQVGPQDSPKAPAGNSHF